MYAKEACEATTAEQRTQCRTIAVTSPVGDLSSVMLCFRSGG